MSVIGWRWLHPLPQDMKAPLQGWAACGLYGVLAGCGGGGTGNSAAMTSGGTPIFPPDISSQPMSQSIPMGLSASFSVTALGASEQYQWLKNGSPIVGATNSTYVTPATTFADSGAMFEVTVSNSAGSVTSTAAALTVTARAPRAGDLRFQQVAAASTVNGYTGLLSPDLISRTDISFAPAVGTSFYVGAANCGAPDMCSWQFVAYQVAPGLTTGYGSDVYGNFQTDLQTPSWPPSISGTTPAASNSVITSLDLEPGDDQFAISWVQSTTANGFSYEMESVPLANLQAAATNEGASSRVITAVSFDGSQITYLAYGWQADTGTIYEAQVATASPADAAASAASLASQGYILSAIGRADANNDVLLVGTRVQGDTMPRPFVVNPPETMGQSGYANVGVIVNLAQTDDPYIFLGER